MLNRLLPVLGYAEPSTPLVRDVNRTITRSEFANTALLLAAHLSAPRYAINLCQNRYYFMLGFVAACLRGQTNLLPANQASGALQQLKDEYPDHQVLDDNTIASAIAALVPASAQVDGQGLSISASHIAAICFTSGSTGKPQAHQNTWGTLVASATRSAAGIFRIHNDRSEDFNTILSVVGTVPPQHMFGLETTVLQPLVNNVAVDSDKPFFPADVCAALQRAPEPRALITTPAHLRACVASGIAFPTLQFVLSATAPLSPTLAAQTEAAWRTKVLEIYGSTETGAIATRRTTEGETWRLLPGGTLSFGNAEDADDSTIQYRPDHAAEAITLHDGISSVDATHFVLTGRSVDLIKVAGKRASLAELNARLLAIPGVKDGVIFQPQADQRVAGLMVVEGIEERDVLLALSAHMDEVFLPRPLRIVNALPRDAVGKLPRAALIAALEQSSTRVTGNNPADKTRE